MDCDYDDLGKNNQQIEKESRKNSSYFSAEAIEALPPPLPLELSGNIFWVIFLRASKKVFFLSGQVSYPHPLLVAGQLKKELFLRLAKV